MTNEQKLEALLQKAIDGGYPNDYNWKIFNGRLANEDDDYAHPYPLIFNHNFAKALWGEKEILINVIIPIKYRNLDIKRLAKNWEYRLQQAVIADDPIDYMYGIVFGDKK